MRLLLDECMPRPQRRFLAEYEVVTIEQAGFKGLKNGELLKVASESFDDLVTVDKKLQYQQILVSLRSQYLSFRRQRTTFWACCRSFRKLSKH